MKITVQMFAAAREIVGSGEVVLETPREATVGDLRANLCQAHPDVAALVNHALFAVDGQYVEDQTPLPEGAEVACIPPVSGG